MPCAVLPQIITPCTVAESINVYTADTHSLSGASVWALYQQESTGVWAPADLLGAVGVQSQYRPNEYFRATSWRYVAEIFAGMDYPQARAATQTLIRRLDAGIAK